MPEVVTILERKSREAARRRAASAEVVDHLKRYATERGGRFLVFGSAAEDRMKFDSDFDVVVDFPTASESEAVEFVEQVCQRCDLPSDVHLKSRASARFLDRIRGHMVAVP